MVDSVKNYGLAGVSANVELGKQGAQIIGNDSSVISLQDKDGGAEVAAIANGTASSHAVNKAQLDDATGQKIQYKKTSVSYNSGTVAIGTTDSNTRIHAVVVESATTWTNANAVTEVTVGDSGDVDRLFGSFDVSTQTRTAPNVLYSSATTLNAYVTQGGASAGTATVTVIYSGVIS